MKASAFSLLELVVVVVIVGVIAAIAIPRLSGFAAGSKVQAAASSVRAMQERVIEYQGLEGSWPGTIDPNWFMGGRIPPNPYDGTSPRGIQSVNAGADVTEPTIKVTGAGKAAYWYNRDNGQVRARVANLGTAGANVALYNAVNGTGVSALNQTKIESGSEEAETEDDGESIELELGG
ncbi:MAG: prepilin-type N-terminal cleavage/methylation domain-containing protein [Leptolyngbya sp. PLA3]|nr:MAG: prepilin-type N-terminal cleavage/methylation domain-containing protein [Cyanobacteria bacterium CYA]MCE7968430.1 prepilin-type N-terminal cleavage/methylation domain-containing protein [Leptolyngbya sp. PL-A3]